MTCQRWAVSGSPDGRMTWLSDAESGRKCSTGGPRGRRGGGDSIEAMMKVIVSNAVDERQGTSVEERRRREEAVQRQPLVESIYRFVVEPVDQPPVALPQPPSANGPRRVGWERQMIEGT
jgi:hypothetical protein